MEFSLQRDHVAIPMQNVEAPCAHAEGCLWPGSTPTFLHSANAGGLSNRDMYESTRFVFGKKHLKTMADLSTCLEFMPVEFPVELRKLLLKFAQGAFPRLTVTLSFLGGVDPVQAITAFFGAVAAGETGEGLYEFLMALDVPSQNGPF